MPIFLQTRGLSNGADTLMDVLYVLPLKVITTQALFLVMAIAIEAFIIQQQMEFSPRKSIEYSASLNLLSTVMGWLIFFTSPFFLPNGLKFQVLNYVAFGFGEATLITVLIPIGFLTFFGTIGIEWLGFSLLQRLLSEQPLLDTSVQTSRRTFFQPIVQMKQGSSSSGISQPDSLNAVLLGNSVSYGVIVIVLIALRVASVV
ncbi:MAG: filament integrity protein FraC [Cyanobacteria bacterium P01_E01_bin.6]